MPPHDLIRAILLAPVDLLWNGRHRAPMSRPRA
ncbi:MAG: NAD-glutamate dehydrogenase [Rhizobiales bacterium]|nr:NAD-glutamate dehydrogenase [Hyphomicrobiales bacterium]